MVTTPEAISIRVDAGQVIGELPHNWNYIGYDEINYTYTPGRAGTARQVRRAAGASRTTCAPITCFAPATVTAFTSGDRPMLI